jgi:hypothetical protein
MKSIRLKSRQGGATFLGILTIVSILLFAVYGGIRLFPLYKENWSINNILEQTGKKLGASATHSEIRLELSRRWATDYVSTLQPKDIEIIRVGNATALRAQYRAEAKFIANVSLVVDFDKTVTLAGSGMP